MAGDVPQENGQAFLQLTAIFSAYLSHILRSQFLFLFLVKFAPTTPMNIPAASPAVTAMNMYPPFTDVPSAAA